MVAPTTSGSTRKRGPDGAIDLTAESSGAEARLPKVRRVDHFNAGGSAADPLLINDDDDDDDDERDAWAEEVDAQYGSQEYDEARLSALQLYGTLDTKIVGVRFYNGYATVGEAVLLRREPQNPYDRNAIRVDNVQREQIGHIPRKMAAKLAPYMDNNRLLMEGYIAGPKMTFDCDLSIKMYGSSDPVEKMNLVNQMKADKLPLDNIKQQEKEEKKRAKERAAAEKARRKKGAGAVVGNGGSRELPPGEFAASSSQGVGIDLNELIENAERFNPRNVDEVVERFGNDETELQDMPMAQQPESIKATLLPFQLQGLHWLLSKENPQLPPPGSTSAVQMWMRSSKDPSMYTNIATNYSMKGRLPNLAKGGILADDMGLGKTVQTISLIMADRALRQAKNEACGATLILSPLSVMSNWSSQIERHIKPEHALRVLTYHGTRKQPINPVEISKYDVVITTYDTLATEFWKNKSPLKQIPSREGLYSVEWRRVVLDEGHNIRNPKAKRSVAAMNLLSQTRWVLTGTPIINTLKDLYSLTKFLRLSGGLDKFELFHSAIIRPVMSGNDIGDQRLRVLMKDLCLRRKKDMKFVDLKLPGISEFVHRITLSQHEQEKYKALEAEAKGAFDAYRTVSGSKQGATAYRHLLEILLRLRQVCNHWKLCGDERFADILAQIEKEGAIDLTPENKEKLQALLQLSIDSQEECPVCMDNLRDPVITCCAHTFCYSCIERVIETQHKCPMCRAELQSPAYLVHPAKEAPEHTLNGVESGNSSKVDAIMQILEASAKKDATTKTVIFSQWTSFLDILGPVMDSMGISYTRIDGAMPALARDRAMQELETNPNCTVLLASLGVCSVGLNLVSANQVIMADSWWAPAIEDQAVDRVYRLGQKREVRVWRVVVEGSVEERVLKIQEDKRKLVTIAMGEKNSTKQKTGRVGDIERLLSSA